MTVTVSEVLPVARATSTRVVVLVKTSIFSRASFLNPGATIVTVYVPGGRSGSVKLPLSLVTEVWTALWPVSTIVT